MRCPHRQSSDPYMLSVKRASISAAKFVAREERDAQRGVAPRLDVANAASRGRPGCRRDRMSVLLRDVDDRAVQVVDLGGSPALDVDERARARVLRRAREAPSEREGDLVGQAEAPRDEPRRDHRHPRGVNPCALEDFALMPSNTHEEKHQRASASAKSSASVRPVAAQIPFCKLRRSFPASAGSMS